MNRWHIFAVLTLSSLFSGAKANSQATLPTQNDNAPHLQCYSGSTPIDLDRLLARARKGEASAQFWSGTAFDQGWCGKPDFEKALQWYTAAAKQGDADAQNSLGQMYEEGRGVKQDYALAASWYRRASEHVPDLGGAGQGRNNLGLLYMQGMGVPRDFVRAYMWFRLAGTEKNLKQAKIEMTSSQVLQAEQMAKDWIKTHPVR